MTKAIVLLSGGMDSAVTAALAREQDDVVVALNMYYGQRHCIERECAKVQASLLYLDDYIEMDLTSLFSYMKSALLPLSGIEVDDDQPKNQVGATYVPGRNSIFLAVAAGIADSIGASYVYYGAHKDDHSGYPDCRPDYYKAMQEALRLGTARGVTLKAPFIDLKKSDIVRIGIAHGVDFTFTYSCYRGEKPSCGTCPTCQLRLQAFAEAGYEDPIDYR